MTNQTKILEDSMEMFIICMEANRGENDTAQAKLKYLYYEYIKNAEDLDKELIVLRLKFPTEEAVETELGNAEEQVPKHTVAISQVFNLVYLYQEMTGKNLIEE